MSDHKKTINTGDKQTYMDLINILHLTVFTSYSVLSGNIIITHISDLKQTNMNLNIVAVY